MRWGIDLVVLSHLEPFLCGKWRCLFNCLLRLFCKQTTVLRNKPTTIATSSECASQSSLQLPQIVLLHETPDYIGTHQSNTRTTFILLYSCLVD